MAAHHVGTASRAARPHVAEVHDSDDLLHVMVEPEIRTTACAHARSPGFANILSVRSFLRVPV